AGVVTGLLFAFSNFVMQSLEKLPNDQGMFAMQQINEKIINPVFMLFFLGTPVLCVLIGVNACFSIETTDGRLLLLGAILYLVGPFGITMCFNVPLNQRLASASTDDANTIWPDYQRRWQRWNHARTSIGILSILLLASGLSAIGS
ncbi:MAG: anthrone oxygenase family protein, partial [Planctomycetota bacterium]